MRPIIITVIGLASGIIFNAALAANPPPFQGKVCLDNANIRTDSTVNSKVICQVKKGDILEVVTQAYDWYKVKLPKDAPSFIRKDLVEIMENTSPTQNYQYAKVSKEKVNIRLEPNDGSAIIGKAEENELVTIVATEDGWYKIIPIEKSYGWVHEKFIVNTGELNLPHSEEPAGKLITLEGVVKPYGMVFKRIATHKLITADNKVFLLKGDQKSLNAVTNLKVKVTAILDPTEATKEKYPLLEIKKMEILD